MTTYEWDIAEKDVVVVAWNNLADGETIATSVWTVPTGIESLSQSISGSNALIKLRFPGTSPGEEFVLRNVITTAGHANGERANGQSFKLRIVKR